MAMTRSNFESLLVEGLREVFFEWLDFNSLIYPKVYEITSSKKKTETDQTIAGIGMHDEKEESLPITYDDFVEGYSKSYTHSTFGKGIRISEELLEDELYGIMNGRAKALANAARYRMEYDHASIFNNATSATAPYPCADALALLSNSHTLAAVPGTTVDNLASSTLSLSALETAFVAFREMVNDQNLLVGIEPSTLLIPPELEFDAYEILNSSGKPYTADASRSLPYALAG